MEAVALMNPQPVIAVRPNRDCSYAVFANVLAISKRKNLSKMTVLGAEQFVQ